MHTPTEPPTYGDLATALDHELDVKLAALRADLAAGHITVIEAATERCEVLELHLCKLIQLRRDRLS
jgi:hypothetical protein